MKKTLLVLLLVTLIFGSVFAEELYSRENVNTVWLDSIQNGEYIYVANLVSKSENEITVLIDIFKNGEYISSYDITPEQYQNSGIYESYVFADTLKFAIIDSKSVGFCFIHISEDFDNQDEGGYFSFFKIENEEIKYFSSMNFSKKRFSDFEDFYFTYNPSTDKFYLTSYREKDWDLYRNDIVLFEFDSDFNITNAKCFYSEYGDYPRNIFAIDENIYLVCDFGKLDFNNDMVIVLDSNLNIIKKYKIENFKGKAICDGKNIFAVDGNSEYIAISCYDFDFNEQWQNLWDVSDLLNVEIFGLCDNGDKIGFQYLEVNEKYQKTKYCLFSKDGSSTDFYESGFFYYPRFYFLKDELFVTNKHFSNFNLKNVWYLKQTSFVGKKSLDEMSKLPIEIYERKPFEIEEPYNPSTESYVKFKEFKEQMKQLYDSVKIGITVSTTDFEVLSEKLNCKTEDCSLSIEKKNLPYIKTSPYTNEFLETIPAFKASER